MIEEATYELHSMCLEVVDAVVASDELMDRFEIADSLRQVLRSTLFSVTPCDQLSLRLLHMLERVSCVFSYSFLFFLESLPYGHVESGGPWASK